MNNSMNYSAFFTTILVIPASIYNPYIIIL